MKLLILSLVLMLIVAGRTQGQQTTGPQNDNMVPPKEVIKPETKPIEMPKPSFWVDSPKDGELTAAGDLVVSVGFNNFKMGVPETANKGGEGHFHLFLDNGEYMPCAADKCTVSGVTPGPHTLKVTLQQNDHSDYPGVQPVFVDFTAQAAADFSITYPAEGAVGTLGTLQVKLELKNFAIGVPETANKAGEGHFHLYLDNGEYIACAATVCDVKGVTPGQHIIKVDMRNNDHSLYGDGAVKSVVFTAR